MAIRNFKMQKFDKKTALAAFKESLHKGKFLMRLNKKFLTTTYDEVLTEAINTAQAEYHTYRDRSKSY